MKTILLSLLLIVATFAFSQANNPVPGNAGGGVNTSGGEPTNDNTGQGCDPVTGCVQPSTGELHWPPVEVGLNYNAVDPNNVIDQVNYFHGQLGGPVNPPSPSSSSVRNYLGQVGQSISKFVQTPNAGNEFAVSPEMGMINIALAKACQISKAACVGTIIGMTIAGGGGGGEGGENPSNIGKVVKLIPKLPENLDTLGYTDLEETAQRMLEGGAVNDAETAGQLHRLETAHQHWQSEYLKAVRQGTEANPFARNYNLNRMKEARDAIRGWIRTNWWK